MQLAAATGKFSFGWLVIGTFVSFLLGAFSAAWKGYFGLVLALMKIGEIKHRLQVLIEAYQQIYSAAAEL